MRGWRRDSGASSLRDRWARTGYGPERLEKWRKRPEERRERGPACGGGATWPIHANIRTRRETTIGKQARKPFKRPKRLRKAAGSPFRATIGPGRRETRW